MPFYSKPKKWIQIFIWNVPLTLLESNIENLMLCSHYTQLLLVSVLCYQQCGIFLPLELSFFIQMAFIVDNKGRKHFSPARKAFIFFHPWRKLSDTLWFFFLLPFASVPCFSSSHRIVMIYLLIFAAFQKHEKREKPVAINYGEEGGGETWWQNNQRWCC